MDDDEMQVVRENIQRSEERQRERRFQLRHEFRMHSELLDAIELSRKIAQVGMILSAIWIVRTAILWEGVSVTVCLFLGFTGIGFVYYVTPFASGMAAHLWFRESTAVTTRQAVIAITLLVEATTFGWIVYLTS